MSFNDSFRRIQAKNEKKAREKAEAEAKAAVPIASTGVPPLPAFNLYQNKEQPNYSRMITEYGYRRGKPHHPKAKTMKPKTSIWISSENAAKLKGYSRRNISRIFDDYGVRKIFFETTEGADKMFVLISEIRDIPYNPGLGGNGKYPRLNRKRKMRGGRLDKYGLPR